MFGKNWQRKLAVMLLAAGLLLGATSPSQAIEFKAQGEWIVGFGVGDGDLLRKTRAPGGSKNFTNADDQFGASQRLRLQLDAVASENLSGTVFFEIGDQTWGKAEEGGALGADGNNVIKLKNAYIDWTVPSTDLQFRMGIQAFAMPNVAGGSAIMDGDAAGITASYKFNDNVALSAFWMRPVNDNYDGDYKGTDRENGNRKGYLDNMDFFGLSLPLTFDGFEITPWAMYGIMGRNAMAGFANDENGDGLRRERWGVHEFPDYQDGDIAHTLLNWHPGMMLGNGALRKSSNAYTSMFFAGLPIAITALDPLNIEFDFNYGYVGGYGSYDVLKRGDQIKTADTLRSGWLAKALVEYKFDWGVPGVFGWYASGDDGNPGNGSERMPSIAGCGNFTSFIAEGNGDFAVMGNWMDKNLSYAGTWGVGLQVRDISFVEDLSHTIRVAYWGGTNSPSMTKYMNGTAWNEETADGPYLTTNDGLLEFNLVNEYQIYENLTANLELGYIVNMIDKGTWDRRWMEETTQRQDAWKAQLLFTYSF